MGLLPTAILLFSCGGIFSLTTPTTDIPAVSPIRLVGGAGPHEGRLEILQHGQWGTICDHFWGSSEAKVVCRQLGMLGADGDVAATPHNAAFGEGTGPIWLSDMNCKGTETSLDECEVWEHSSHDRYPCSHSDDASVVCKQAEYQNSVVPESAWNATELPATSGRIRLIGGTNAFEGRVYGVVQVFHNGVWGMVCNDQWSRENGQVACRQLGFGQFRQSSQPRDGQTDIVWLDDVACTGSESSLDECPHRDWGYHNCNPRYEAIQIMCNEDPDPSTTAVTPLSASTIPPVRLVNGTGPDEGRVEIYLEGQWGTVCDQWWDLADAAVVCKQLGYREGAVASPRSASFGEGSGPIWLTEVQCTSGYRTEDSLDECRRGSNLGACDHSRDAGVICKLDEYQIEVVPTAFDWNTVNTTELTPTIPVRLVDGSRPFNGRVEILHQGIWGTVCDDNWDTRDGDVVCRQLGFGPARYTFSSFQGGSGPVWLDDVMCTGDESSLDECSHRDWGYHNCRQGYEDACVYCSELPEPQTTLSTVWWNTTEPSFLSVRLVGGHDPNEGRVEVFIHGVWGTVCDNQWDMRDGDVVCRQLGFGPAKWIIPQGGYGKGSGPIWLNNMACVGEENNLGDCLHSVGDNDCSHSQDAGVYCWREYPSNRTTEYPTTLMTPTVQAISQVRLVGGSGPHEGRVEILHQDQWGTICDDSWNIDDATVICSQLGFELAISAPPRAFFGQGTGKPIWLDDVGCTGTENSLDLCSNNGWGNHNCAHYEDAGAVCKRGGLSVVSDVRATAASSSELYVMWSCSQENSEFQLTIRLIDRDQCNYLSETYQNETMVTEWITNMTYTWQGLYAYSTYTISVQSRRSSEGAGYVYGGLNETTATTGEAAPTGTPYRVYGWSIGAVHACLGFQPVPCGFRNGNSEMYKYVLNNTNSSVVSNMAFTPGHYGRLSLSTCIRPLQCLNLYVLQMAGVTGAGFGPYFTWDFWTRLQVGDRRATFNSTTQELFVTWSPSSSLGCPDMATEEYLVYVHKNEGKCSSRSRYNTYSQHITSNTSLTLSLKPYSSYQVGLTIVSDLPKSSNTVWGSSSTPQEAPAASPSNVRLMSSSEDPLRLSYEWDEIPCLQRNGIILGYPWEIATVDGDTVATGEVEETNVTISGVSLPYTTAYKFRVAAKTIAGTGVFSEYVVGQVVTLEKVSSTEPIQTIPVESETTLFQPTSLSAIRTPIAERTSWIDCEGSFMTVFVNRSFIQDGLARDLHLLDARCRGFEYDEHFIEMQTMYDLCGTTVEQEENGTMVFKNEILYIPSSSANDAKIVSRDFALRIPLTCRMNTGGIALMTSFHPNMRTVQFEEENFGSFGFQLVIYRDDSFNTSYDMDTDYPVQVRVKDTVYFEASVNSRENLQLFVDTCRATPTPNPSDTPNYVILKNGCPKDDTFRMLPSTEPTVQRFSLEAFAFIGRFTTVFVHCEMLVCKFNDASSRCAQGCRSRGRRDLKEDKSSRLYSLNQGPLVVQKGPPNFRNRRVAPIKLHKDDAQET